MRANVPSSHVRFCFPPMGAYGAMHAKIQLLKFTNYLRIVVPSGNLTRYDWGETGVLENVRSTFFLHTSATRSPTRRWPRKD